MTTTDDAFDDDYADFREDDERYEALLDRSGDFYPFCFVCGEQFPPAGDDALCAECEDMTS